MSNPRERRNSSETEVYSIELNCNTNEDQNETPTGENEADTGTRRSTPQPILDAWKEECSNITLRRVHDAWLGLENVVTAAKHAIKQCTGRLKDSLWFQHFYGPIIVALAIASTAIFTLWPLHNSVLYPEYWYEILGPIVIFRFCVSGPLTVTNIYSVMKVDVLLTWNQYIKLFVGLTLEFVVPYVGIHIIWVDLLQYNHPMPFVGQISNILSLFITAIRLWFMFPAELRKKNNPYRKQIFSYLMLTPAWIIIVFEFIILKKLFKAFPLEFQWCISLVLPAVQEFNIWAWNKLLYKAAGGNTQSATISGISFIGSFHMLMVITLLDSEFEPITEYLIMICECIPEIWSTIKIIKLHKQGRHMNDEKNKEVECLVLEEFLTFGVPIVYCTSFLLAYFGPNATILGHVYTDMWAYEKVDDPVDKLTNVMTFVFIDVVQVMILGLTLYHFCKLNVYEECVCLLGRYGPLICLNISSTICTVR